MCVNWEIFWSALSSVATTVAVITAFVLVRYDHKLSQLKKMKIEWRDALTVQDEGVPLITIKFINVGNRKIIIDRLCVVLNPSKREFQSIKWLEKLPCPLEIEETETFVVPALEFAKCSQLEIDEKNTTPNNEIVLKMTDTAGCEYLHRTGRKFADYLAMLKVYSGGTH